MIERQEVDHRSEPQLPSALRHRGQKQTRRRRIAERRVVVLGQMVAIEPAAVVRLDQPQPILEVPGQRLPAVVQMVENPKTHLPLLDFLLSPRKRVPACRFFNFLPDPLLNVSARRWYEPDLCG